MALKNKILIGPLLLISLSMTTHALAQTQLITENFIPPLPELLAKQAINNIRFISFDGKYTYYQKRTGQLSLASNYKIFDVIKGKPLDQFNFVSSGFRKKLIITQNKNYHSFLSIRAKESIYLINYGETESRYLGDGLAPKLHRNDLWISYYDPYTKEINFAQTNNDAIKFKVKINAKKDPYFIPQVAFLSDEAVLFTDSNQDGMLALFKYTRSTNKAELIKKFLNPFLKIELCSNNSHLYLAQFGLSISSTGSEIREINESNLATIDSIAPIYLSPLSDVGNIVCSDEKELFFSKNIGISNSNPAYEVASLNLETKNLKIHTYFKNVTQLIDMDGILLINEKGKTYIVKGNNDFKYIDVLAAPEKEKP